MNNLSNPYTYNIVTPHSVTQSDAMNFQFGFPFPGASNFNNIPYGMPPVQSNITNPTEPWIDSWLVKIGKTQPTLTNAVKKPKASITSARESLRACLDILDKLNAISGDLRTNVQKLSSAEWKKKTIKIGQLKENYSIIMNTLSNPENMTSLQKAVKERKKKRSTQKKKRIQRQEDLKKEREEHRNINQHIDRWLEVKKEEDNRIKMEELMNKDVDCSLSDVNKKKADAKKNLALIRALVKLRQVRETMHTQRGEKTSLEDKQAFSLTTAKMLKIWENTSKQYNAEELMLKTMLEKTATETLRNKELLKERETLFLWEKAIFGNKVNPTPENATHWALTAAERDMETFIAIRKSWDTFLVPPPQGSSLPISWVFPPNQCTEEWKKFQAH
ncbi:uncharacterized protein LOC123315266 [Coccinella septempunctata]|uniref:uncharacterized protein LOC123315266 n=1 Tax=Coccinella septempunctata TaxID=41139 RepID=UPI001D068417|nr:uncharacterized protein LOC123315266 [Coccinella septempunctata]